MSPATASPSPLPSALAPPSPSDADVAAVRAFSRFYTSRIGALGDSFLGADIALPAARLLWEIGDAGPRTAATLARELGLDPGYLSRLVKILVAKGLLARTPSPDDRRAVVLALTSAGSDLFATLEARSSAEVAGMLAPLTPADRREAVAALALAQALIEGRPRPPRAYQIRAALPGEGGWIMGAFSGALIRDFGLDRSFEPFVGQIVVDFLHSADSTREHAWIAEVEGAPAGSIMLVRQSDEVAKLRLLVVDDRARGLGIGRKLVAECIRFARAAGYRRITLWTYACLVAARRIYAEAGFRLTGSEQALEFGQPMVNETWDLDL